MANYIKAPDGGAMLNADDFVVGKDEIGRSTVGLNRDGLGKEIVYVTKVKEDSSKLELYFCDYQANHTTKISSVEAKQMWLDFRAGKIDVYWVNGEKVSAGNPGGDDIAFVYRITSIALLPSSTGASFDEDYNVYFWGATKGENFELIVNWDGGQ